MDWKAFFMGFGLGFPAVLVVGFLAMGGLEGAAQREVCTTITEQGMEILRSVGQ